MKKILNTIFILIIAVFLNSCGDANTNLSDVKICDKLTIENSCEIDNTEISSSANYIFVSWNLNNAPEGTSVKINWYYSKNEKKLIDEIILTPKGNKSYRMHAALNKPHKGWPIGKYEVALQIIDEKSNKVVKKFYISDS